MQIIDADGHVNDRACAGMRSQGICRRKPDNANLSRSRSFSSDSHVLPNAKR